MSGSGFLSGEGARKPHLLRGSGGVASEVADVRDDIARDLGPMVLFAIEEWTDPPAASATALKTATATVASAVTLSASDLTGDGVLPFPRQIVFTTAGSTPADAPATATVTGKDAKGRTISEVVTLAQTATTATSKNCFKEVTSVAYPAADGTDATVAIGTGAAIGLSHKLVARAGAANINKVNEAGTYFAADAVPGTPALATAGAAPPYGAYAPDTAADGSNDYSIEYEYDPTDE